MLPQKTGKGLIKLSDCITNLKQTIKDRASTKTSSGLRSHFYDLDNLTGGFAPASLIAIASSSGMGKSTFALAIAANVAKYGDKSVAYFSLSKPRIKLVEQLLAQESDIELRRIITSQITETEYQRLGSAIALLPRLPLFIDDTPNISIDSIRAELRNLQSYYKQKDLGLIIIDSLHLINETSAINRTEELSKIIRSLKRLAKEFSVPILMLCEINRSVDVRVNKRPRLSDISSCGSIEDAADLVLMFYRDDYYKSFKNKQEIVEIIVAKDRNGVGGTIKLMYKPDFARFYNLAS